MSLVIFSNKILPSLDSYCGFLTFKGGLLGFAFGSFFAGTGPSPFSPMAPTGTEALGWKAQTVEGIKHMGRSGVISHFSCL